MKPYAYHRIDFRNKCLLIIFIGDAEMGNRLNRVVRACLESDVNPIECKYSLRKLYLSN